jgi:predicted transcriptional regulator
MIARRRQSTQKAVRERAAERGRVKLDASVEQRFAQLSSRLNNLEQTLQAQSKRTAALQAQIDHLDARIRGN